MKTASSLIALVFALGLGMPTAMAGKDMHEPVKQMANILMTLNHGPDRAQKSTLRKIADNPEYSANLRAIAMSMLRLNHRASADDKARLRQIMQDNSASIAERELARIVAELNHKASSSDRMALRTLIDNPSQAWAAN